jgi:hypothetical protein
MLAFAETAASGLGCTILRKGDLIGALPMREFVLALSPLAAVLYFVVNQDQFRELLAWVGTLIR